MSEIPMYFERKEAMEFEVEAAKLTDGLGYGDGTISYEDRKEIVGHEIVGKVEKVVTSNEVLVEVSVDKDGNRLCDDGCGDGRPVYRIFQNGIEKAKSLFRAKVFGGGPVMAAADIIGQGKANGSSLQDVFKRGLSTLKRNLVDFGGHTDTHAHGDNCGCGAIDKATAVVSAVSIYADKIQESIAALGVDIDGMDEVVGNFVSYASEIEGQEYSGKKVMDEIIESGKVIKELDDDHKEMFILLNTVEGYTVDQEKIREISEGKIQVFAVDVWRLKEIAEKLHPDESEEIQNKAFLSELVYTLGTAAVLTKGDLPVYMISKKPQLVVA